MKKHGWVFTLNNYAPGELPLRFTDTRVLEAQMPYKRWVPNWENPQMVFVGFGKEVAPSTGTPHLQGLVVFKRAVGLRSLKKLNERANWQPMRGTFEEAQKYCSKENFTEWIEQGFTKKYCREKVEEDHVRSKVIQDENDSIESLSKSLYGLSEDMQSLSKSVHELVTLNKYVLQKLNNLTYKDKFV
jgi:hypothetical protein